MSENSLSAKILGYRSFNVKEAVKICQILGIESAEDKAQIFLTESSQKWDEIQIRKAEVIIYEHYDCRSACEGEKESAQHVAGRAR